MKDDSTKEFVIQLLVHLDILIVPKTLEQLTNVYLVPCMIKTIRPDLKNLQHHRQKTICLQYSLTQHSIPSALAFKVIGAAIISWQLKEEDNKPGKPCLYHKAAVLNVSEDDELRIWLEDNRVMVNLTNKKSLLSISPDVAASIQECLSNSELKQEPRDKHLVRLGYQISINDFQGFYINLGMTRRQWDNTLDMYDGHSMEGIMSMALVKWKESKKSKLLDAMNPTLKDLSDALEKVELDSHVICQVFREETKLRGNYALQLGIELGVSFYEVENSLYKCPKDLPGLIEDILKKWKAKSKMKTFKRLMLTLQRVNGGGVDFLQSMLKTPNQ
ncbi:unnamed protein product [Mytilus edulis]|uniref:Death domain-containing protein n=1 Tax=Mytilus edulis TaxID=6550 RepID=A0A8S3SZZ2_MYTED|nr:unnamed protein product [Mytilus edulis]